jgi:multidrug transporter EmrE-like cation transporter
MSDRLHGFIYIAAAIVLTLYGQLVVKWQVNVLGTRPAGVEQNLTFLFRMLTSPWVLSGFAAAFGAAMVWMLAVSRLDLSYAYPFMSLTFPSILLLSYVFFKEPVSIGNVVGVGFIVLGIAIHSCS